MITSEALKAFMEAFDKRWSGESPDSIAHLYTADAQFATGDLHVDSIDDLSARLHAWFTVHNHLTQKTSIERIIFSKDGSLAHVGITTRRTPDDSSFVIQQRGRLLIQSDEYLMKVFDDFRQLKQLCT